jgi:hypothetical protein
LVGVVEAAAGKPVQKHQVFEVGDLPTCPFLSVLPLFEGALAVVDEPLRIDSSTFLEDFEDLAGISWIVEHNERGLGSFGEDLERVIRDLVELAGQHLLDVVDVDRDGQFLQENVLFGGAVTQLGKVGAPLPI